MEEVQRAPAGLAFFTMCCIHTRFSPKLKSIIQTIQEVRSRVRDEFTLFLIYFPHLHDHWRLLGKLLGNLSKDCATSGCQPCAVRLCNGQPWAVLYFSSMKDDIHVEYVDIMESVPDKEYSKHCGSMSYVELKVMRTTFGILWVPEVQEMEKT